MFRKKSYLFEEDMFSSKEDFKQWVKDYLDETYGWKAVEIYDNDCGEAYCYEDLANYTEPMIKEILWTIDKIPEDKFPLDHEDFPTLWVETSDAFNMFLDYGDTSGVDDVLGELLDWIKEKVGEIGEEDEEVYLRRRIESGDWVDRARIAEDPRTPVSILRELAKDENDFVRAKVAENPNTPIDVLEELTRDEEDIVRKDVVNNPNCPEYFIRELAKDESDIVRENVASDERTPVDILEELAKDINPKVRAGVAENPNTPVDVLRELSKDEDWHVRAAVVENPNVPIDVLEELAKDEDESVRGRVAQNPDTPVDILRQLAKDEDLWVRSDVAENPNTPVDVLKMLLNDDKDWVVWKAEGNLVRKGIEIESSRKRKYLFEKFSNQLKRMRKC